MRAGLIGILETFELMTLIIRHMVTKIWVNLPWTKQRMTPFWKSSSQISTECNFHQNITPLHNPEDYQCEMKIGIKHIAPWFQTAEFQTFV